MLVGPGQVGLVGRQGASGNAGTFNFLSGTLDPRITFTRASNGTEFSPSGSLITATTNEPRFDYNPLSLQPRGLLLEGARTNIIADSDNYGVAGWLKTRSSITASAGVSPTGASNASKLVEDTTASATHTLERNIAGGIVLGSTYTQTVYFKAAERTSVQIRFTSDGTVWGTANEPRADYNLATGTVSNFAGGSLGVSFADIQNVGNGWYRCVLAATAQANGISSIRYLLLNAGATSYTGDGVSGALLFGSQAELGSFASSYIPTTGTAATRADDSALNTILSSIGYNQAQGTIVIELEPMVTTLAAFQIPFSITNGTANNRIILEHTTAGNGSWRVTDGGVAQVAGLAATPGFTANSITKRAFAYAANDFAACANGGTVVTQGTGTVPSNLNQLAIGHYAVGSVNSPWFGWIRRLTYYPTRLPNATLQALST